MQNDILLVKLNTKFYCKNWQFYCVSDIRLSFHIYHTYTVVVKIVDTFGNVCFLNLFSFSKCYISQNANSYLSFKKEFNAEFNIKTKLKFLQCKKC